MHCSYTLKMTTDEFKIGMQCDYFVDWVLINITLCI